MATVELTVAMPLLMTILLGVWELSRVVQVKQILCNAVREGARQASTGRLTNTQIQQVVVRFVQNAGLTTSRAVVTVTNLTNTTADASAASQFDQVRVTASIPFGDARLISSSLINSASSTITAQAT